MLALAPSGWSSSPVRCMNGPADCARRANSDIVRLTHGVPFAEHISWSRMRSDPGCRLPQQAALPGTYTATVTYGAAHSRTEVFLLH